MSILRRRNISHILWKYILDFVEIYLCAADTREVIYFRYMYVSHDISQEKQYLHVPAAALLCCLERGVRW